MDRLEYFQELLTRVNDVHDCMEEALGHFSGIEDECRRGLLETHLRGAVREISAQIAELVSLHEGFRRKAFGGTTKSAVPRSEQPMF